MKHKNKEVIKWVLFVIGITLIISSSIYFYKVNVEFDVVCADCITQYCMDNDFVCGDFGLFYFKLAFFYGLVVSGIFILLNIIILSNEK
ncbi:MAG TPA: hypothetical protein VMZ91_08980 [Candidatus Paceibacterota bacterium]|nr:hypothetical protein [Candidatus Paceibacterota bacterium]